MKNTSAPHPAVKVESTDKYFQLDQADARNLLLLVALAGLLFFWKLGDVPFYNRGEPREGLVVWEMYKTGNWILPTINGDYIPYKPPLFHWIAVIASVISGHVNEFTLRFPSALCGTLGVLMTYLTARRLWNREAGVIAAVVLATSPDWWQAAALVQVDMTLAFFVSASLLLFYHLYRRKNSAVIGPLVLAFLLALATLSKGPLGLAVPAVVVVSFLVCRRDLKFLLKLPLFRGALIYLSAVGFWYGWAYAQGGWPFIQRQIINETLLTGTGAGGHPQPFYYFVPVLFYHMLPWSFFFPSIALFLFRRRRHLSDDHLLFPLIWLVGGFVFFSLSIGKRGVYLLPLYPAAALLFGAWWAELEKDDANADWFTRAVGFFVAISCAMALSGLFIYFAHAHDTAGVAHVFGRSVKLGNLSPVLRSMTPPSTMLWSGLALSGGGVLLLFGALLLRKWNAAFVALAFIAIVMMGIFKAEYDPYIASQRTLRPFVTRMRERVNLQTPLVFYRAFDYGTVFYSGRHIPFYKDKALELKRPYLLLMWEEDWKRLSEHNRLKILDISEGRGPVGRHRMLLVEPQQDTPIVDPKGYGPNIGPASDIGVED
jgi:4-amino-4-deoxy-L-arabinose transferase-like glycosyltransferase